MKFDEDDFATFLESFRQKVLLPAARAFSLKMRKRSPGVNTKTWRALKRGRAALGTI